MRTIIISGLVWLTSIASADDKLALLADEQAAFDKAKPVFERYCAGCHTQSGKQASAKKLDHFEMTSYPFGGHHAATIGPTIRKVLAVGGGKATMPDNRPGTVTGDDLALIAAWTKAWDAASTAGAHLAAPHHHDHDRRD
jgi:mono/diheme cytochrome c family protein